MKTFCFPKQVQSTSTPLDFIFSIPFFNMSLFVLICINSFGFLLGNFSCLWPRYKEHEISTEIPEFGLNEMLHFLQNCKPTELIFNVLFWSLGLDMVQTNVYGSVKHFQNCVVT